MIKKISILFITITMVFLLVGCGEVSKVEKLIDAIGEVTINSNDAINAAQSAFDALEDKQKVKVKNTDVLLDANDQYAELVREKNYSDAVAAFDAEEYNQAKDLFSQLGDYRDAAVLAAEAAKAAFYVEATALFESNDYAAAADLFLKAEDYKDAVTLAAEAEKAAFYVEATALFEANDYAAAADLFLKAEDYKDAATLAVKAQDKAIYANSTVQIKETVSTDIVDFTLEHCKLTYYVSNVSDTYVAATDTPNSLFSAKVGTCYVSMTVTITNKDRGGYLDFGGGFSAWDPADWSVIYNDEKYQMHGFDLNFSNLNSISLSYGAIVNKETGKVITKVGTSNDLIDAGDTVTYRFFGIIKVDPESLNDGFELNVKVPNSERKYEDFKYIVPAIS